MSAPALTPDWAGVTLTPLTASDVEQLNVWQNDPQIRDLIRGFRGPVRAETTADWVKAVSDQNLKTRAVFAIRHDGGFKGLAQLHGIDWVQRDSLLGVYVGEPTERGAGLGRVATSLLLDYAFRGLDLHRVTLEVIAANTVARRLYESLGFTLEGVLRQAYLRDGVREDVMLFGLLQSEWTFDLPPDANRLLASRT
ncbi:GNAT family protein [Phenylobacterium sp.]|jgi:UDP-4-amino-4,6-dideoxy-N-acetyl-beta-L-altrosamine N-acetyltransferase|uniref:GNAT family N-acetyltransferase n=1 Tax=Phenylobacterium sp. TaxID=1871053 RepID=UPI002F41DFF5